MLCQSCGKRNATTHIKNIVNGEMTEYYLCGECASRIGYGDLANGFSMSIHDMLSAVLKRDEPIEKSRNAEVACEVCGCTFAEIVRSGKIGCSECYEKFRDRLRPSIQRIHGNSRHVGRVPFSASLRAQLDEQIDEARKQLKQAIEEENFEEAVRLRDRIRAAEEEKRKNS